MSDDMRNRGEPDRSRISLSQDHEIEYWTSALGVSAETLRDTVARVGNDVGRVRAALGK